MQKNKQKTARPKKRKQTALKEPVSSRRTPRKIDEESIQPDRCSYIIDDNGATTHVVISLDEYERLILAEMANAAIATLDDPESEWIDADQFALELAAEKIAAARKAAGLTQKALGKKLGIPQSQISRIERNPDHTTVRTLKRIAKALKVDVRALL